MAIHQKLKPALARIKAIPAVPRQMLGILLLLGGFLGALPILGFWMLPLGLLVLSVDFQWARRAYLSIISLMRRWRDTNSAAKKTD